MTLDDLLALLPDNDSGEITAADLRTIVTELWTVASVIGQGYAYQYTVSDTSPGAGKLGLDQGWSNLSMTAYVSETTDDGESLTFTLLDAVGGYFWLNTSAGQQLRASVIGPTVDQGSYREIPLQIDSIVGTEPGNNSRITMGLVVPMYSPPVTPG